jgi:hypothetical protein
VGHKIVHLALVGIRSSIEEAAMLGEDHHGSIVQRGIDEALACRDMLERTPPKPSLADRVATSSAAFIRTFVRLQRATNREAERPLPTTGIVTNNGEL